MSDNNQDREYAAVCMWIAEMIWQEYPYLAARFEDIARDIMRMVEDD